MTTAFVLSGGGSLGAVQVGMLQALTARDETPDLLVGTSAGALNASYVAGYGTSPAALDALPGIWIALRLSGEEVLLSTGDAISAVLASTAIPGLLPAVRRQGLTLVDGALANNAAISQAISLGADRIFVLPAGVASDKAELHVIPPLCPLSVSSADFGHARELIDRATIATGKWLDSRNDLLLPRQERFLSLHGRLAAPPRQGPAHR